MREVYESRVVTRYTWKYNKLHDPWQRKYTPVGWREESGSDDRRKIVEGRTIITRSLSRFVGRYVVGFRLWICYQLGMSARKLQYPHRVQREIVYLCRVRTKLEVGNFKYSSQMVSEITATSASGKIW